MNQIGELKFLTFGFWVLWQIAQHVNFKHHFQSLSPLYQLVYQTPILTFVTLLHKL